jgi:hypothetical protein
MLLSVQLTARHAVENVKFLQLVSNSNLNYLALRYKLGCKLIVRANLSCCEELDGAAVSALQRAIAKVKQRWLVIGCDQ